MTLGLLISGNLGYTLLRELVDTYPVHFVMTDKGSRSIVTLCLEKGIPSFVGNPRNGKAQAFIESKKIDVLLSINYLFLVESDLISLPGRYAINFHGSLLPKYRGRTPHVWSIINGEQMTGVTAHLMTLGCDEGDIVDQISIPIGDDDTGADVLSKFITVYPTLVKSVLAKCESGTIITQPQENDKATFFPKRTSKDGQIDWNWQRLRIRNWVRAQADPYPGAFSFVDENIVVIDKVAFHDGGYNGFDPNGLIKSENPILVKSPNGLLELTVVREGKQFLKKDKILR